MKLWINGQASEPELPSPATLADLLAALALKQDRVAIERNGEIVPRNSWAAAVLAPEDRIEIVQFVGGGGA